MDSSSALDDRQGQSSAPLPEKAFANQIEIRVIGQMRSGNHVIVDWLKSLYGQRSVCFLNNILHGDCDPFLNCEGFDHTHAVRPIKRRDLKAVDRDVLILSYEDRKSLDQGDVDLLTSVQGQEYAQGLAAYIGNSRHRFDVVIVRDPFNCLASRLALLRQRGGMGGLEDIGMIKHHWKAIARLISAPVVKGDRERVVISYNRWLVDQAYRSDLAGRLLATADQGIPEQISRYGGGSSFAVETENVTPLTLGDLIRKAPKVLSLHRWKYLALYARRLRHRPTANNDQFLNRWQLLASDGEFRALMADQELLELSESIFGEIPGTRQFVNEVIQSTSLGHRLSDDHRIEQRG